MAIPLHRSVSLLAAATFVLAAPLLAQTMPQPQPQPDPMVPAIAEPVDKPYVGPVKLMVDLSDNARRVATVHEEIPVAKGAKELVLLYPQWIPGNHSPTGPISKLGGIVTTVDGTRVQWVRDRVNVYAFHVPLNAGAKSVGLDFQYLSPVKRAEGRIEISNEIADLEWNEVVMYPAGYFARQIPFDTTLKLPEGWKYATALETASADGATVTFKQTPLNTLVDSPLYAGVNFKRVDLSPAPTDIVHLDVFSDKAEDLEITPDELAKHKQLALEADKLYGSHHYDHYDFLLLLSDKVGGVGLEHHQSSEDGHGRDYFTDWAAGVGGRDLLGHEYTHSWDGKFRRPADLWTANFNVPMRDDLLWVYEGMTQYFGNVLTARAGMRTPEETRDVFARVAAGFEVSPSREWRPLVDTTNQPTVSQRSPVTWVSWQRPEDYYTEGELIWLDADTKIRELTNGQKSLDDFAKLFYGVYNGSYVTFTYHFEDVVKALNTVAPFDWDGFLKTHVYDLHPAVPEDGFTRGGYKLVYTDKPTAWIEKAQTAAGYADFSTSLGFTIGSARGGNSGGGSMVGSVYWNSPAFKLGVTPDMELISVNGTAYAPALLKKTILDAEKDSKPIELVFKREDKYQTLAFDYHKGLRYPSLQRVEGTPARFDDILAPSKAPMPSM
ncbi:M61 family metallopeptidase [Acidipila sp. EB88]|uniref:M61 family metallopeptidase n=1 Tax=Acidipila sp. EB88 TaxID=2305226 RepID=UPI000F5E1059|nr:M61 family metallopeptidase [Acidipila sp. EB88]RRA48126.1 M61 family peptidase [Acidipila sp. EB88]